MTIKLTINLRDSSMPRKNEAGAPIKPTPKTPEQLASEQLESYFRKLRKARRKFEATLKGE